MELKDIKRINQDIYTLDVDITRSSKVIFIAALIICITKNTDFQNANKLTTLINFASDEVRPIDQLIDLAKKEVEKMGVSVNVRFFSYF